MTRGLSVPICLLAWAGVLSAQDTSLTPARVPPISPVIKWGKWVTLGAAIGFTVAGVVQHNHAQDSWNQLLTRCGRDNQKCMLDASGKYEDYESELLYEETVYYDHLARHRIVIGQVNLLASVGMFVLEFKRRQMAPPNIPLHGLHLLIEPARGRDRSARFGLTLHF